MSAHHQQHHARDNRQRIELSSIEQEEDEEAISGNHFQTIGPFSAISLSIPSQQQQQLMRTN
jgi:hypothetical protein